MWQKGSESFVASVDFAHRTSFSNSYIFPLMFGYKPFCLSAEYNETVVLRRYPIFLSGYLPVYRVSFCLFI